MQRGYRRFIEIIHSLFDLLILNISLMIAYLMKFNRNPLSDLGDYYYVLFIVVNICWLVIALSLGVYSSPRFLSIENSWKKTIQAILLHAAIIIVFIFSVKGVYYSRGFLLRSYIMFSVFVLVGRSLFLFVVKQYRKSGFNFKKVIIVGAGTIGNQLYNYFNSDISLGYRFEGFFHDKPEQCIPKEMVKGNVSDVENYVIRHPVDEMYCALPLNQPDNIKKLMSLADNSLIRFKMVPDFRGLENRKVELNFYYDTPVLTFRKEPLENFFNSMAKRAFDIMFSVLVFVVLLPVLMLIIVAIKISSPGPVLFAQKRSGRNNEIFTCYKFRSMRVNDHSDIMQAKKNDPRITRIGKFLRKTNLDELPQFFNVLMGQMSVVGPRPHMLSHTEEYAKITNKFLVRHFVKPGITGWAQVNGFRGPIDPRLMYKRVKLDMWYIENWSLLLDIKIIFQTLLNMVVGEKNAF